MRRLDANRREERRSEILDAAMAVIRREGATASMEQIAAEAGVTKPIVYRQFRDRSDLVAAMAERFAGGLAESLSASGNSGREPRDVMAAMIDAYLAFVERDPEIYRFIVQEVAPAQAAFMRAVGDQVAVALARGLDDPRAAEPVAHGIVGMVHAAGDWWLSTRSMPRADVVEHLTSVLWSGLVVLLPVGAAR
jgi:AcrR family transcriptional regulator